MKCKFNFGPNADQFVHLPNNPVTQLMIQSGVLALVEDNSGPVPQPTVKISLNQTPTSGEWFVQATDGRTTLMFRGTSAELRSHDFWLAGKAHRAPEELIEAYRAARQRDYTTLKEGQA